MCVKGSLSAACYGLLAAVCLLWLGPYRLTERHLMDYNYGIELYRGIPRPGLTFSMPLETVPRSFARYELSSLGEKIYLLAAKAALPLSFWAFARLLAPGWAAALSTCAALFIAMRVGVNHEMLYFSVLCFCAAAALVLRSRDFSVRMSVLLGLCIGLSLLARSTLFLLGPAVLAWDGIAGRVRGWRRFLTHAFALAVLPVLFLFPWAYMGHEISKQSGRAESSRVDDNVLLGALGFTMTAEAGSYAYQLLDMSPGQSVMLRAAGEVLMHPLRYSTAVLKRLWLFVYWQPAAALGGLAGLALVMGKVPGIAAAAFFMAYYLLLHSLMPVEPRYYFPIWMLACAVPAAIFYRGQAAAASSVMALRVVLAPLLVLAAMILALVCLYPARAARFSGYAGLAYRENNAWLLSRACSEALAGGELAKAADFCGRAVSFPRPDPDSGPLLLAYLMSRRENVDGALLRVPLPDYKTSTRAYLALYVISPLLRGSTLEAERRYAKVSEFWKGGIGYFRSVDNDEQRRLQRKLYDTDRRLERQTLFSALSQFPPGLRGKIAAGLLRIGARSPAIEYAALSAGMESPGI